MQADVRSDEAFSSKGPAKSIPVIWNGKEKLYLYGGSGDIIWAHAFCLNIVQILQRWIIFLILGFRWEMKNSVCTIRHIWVHSPWARNKCKCDKYREHNIELPGRMMIYRSLYGKDAFIIRPLTRITPRWEPYWSIKGLRGLIGHFAEMGSFFSKELYSSA